MKERRPLDMTTGAIAQQLLVFSIPLILSALVNVTYGIVDNIVLGKCVGDLAMAAAGTTNAPFNMIYNFFAGFSLGVTILCGSFLGKKDSDGLRRFMHTAVLTGCGLGLLVCGLGTLFSKPILMAMKTPADILSDSTLYFRIRFLGTPFSLVCAFYDGIMMSHGDTKQITFIGIISGIVNLILNLFFVLICNLEVVGVALGTILSQFMDFIWKSIIVFSPKGLYKLRIRNLHINWKLCGDLLKLGIPNGLSSTVLSFSSTLLQSSVNAFGSLVIAGSAAAGSVENLISTVYSGVPRAVVAAVSQCYGAKNFRRIRQITGKGLALCVSMVAVISLSVVVFRTQALGLFTSTEEVINAGIPRLYALSVGYLIHCFDQVLGSGLKGLHKSSLTFTINFSCICGSRFLWILFVIPKLATAELLFAIYPISWLISSVGMYIVYRHTLKKEETAYLRSIEA